MTVKFASRVTNYCRGVTGNVVPLTATAAALLLLVASRNPIRDYVKGEWLGTPPCVRRVQRLWLIPVVFVPLIFGAWMARLWLVPNAGSALWVTIAMPLSLFGPQFVAMFFMIRAARKLKRAFVASGGRLCTNCAHDLSGLDDVGKCPECGHGFDAALDAAAWKKSGMGRGKA